MDFSSKPDTDVYIGPYRATKLWNDIIYTCRKGIPCGRHRRYMRTYEDCFVASNAVDWLLKHLRSNLNFGPEVTRCQTLQLLRKIHKSGVFEDVRTSKHGRSEFSDSGRLYRFVHRSPPRASRPVLVPRTNFINAGSRSGEDNLGTNLPEPSLQECRLVGRILAADEVEDVWKNTTLYKLQQAMGTIDLGDILDSTYVNGRFIHHNSLYVNKSGVVTNIDAKDQLPHWAMSAMKCLARWPEKVDDNLPSYPGFEKDVFGVVKDYFCGLSEPLMTFDMYEVITNVFVHCENRLPRHSSPSNASGRYTPKSSTWSYASLENLLLDIVKNAGLDTSPNQHRLGLHSASTFNLSNFNPSAESTNIHIEKKYGSSPELKVTRYETAFGPENKTVTRVFYTNGVATDYGHCSYGMEEPCMPLETHFDVEPETSATSANNTSHVNFERAQSLERLNMEVQFESDRGYTQTDYAYNYSGDSSGFYETPPSHRESFSSFKSTNSGSKDSARSSRSARGYISRCSSKNNTSMKSDHMPVLDGAKLRRASRLYSASSPDLPGLAKTAPRTMSRLPERKLLDFQGSMFSMADFTSPEKRDNSQRWRNSTFLNMSNSYCSAERTKRALQLVCLLLPPANRRRLQLLLKLMYKMVQNEELCLDRTQTTRQLLLDTFTRSILSSHEEADMDELLVRQIVSFLIDNYTDIMTVPQDLKVTVEERLKEMQKPQVSVEEYETQKMSSSQKALADLLEEIIADQSMSIKDKKKRLKQFSKTYPSLYYRRFPTSESEAEVIPQKPKIKPPLLVKPLMKLRGLRL